MYLPLSQGHYRCSRGRRSSGPVLVAIVVALHVGGALASPPPEPFRSIGLSTSTLDLRARAAPSTSRTSTATTSGTAKVRVIQASVVPMIFTVNSTADTDDGSCDAASDATNCTLREAILAANANTPAEDTIAFNIVSDPPVPPPYVIGVLSDLPDITEAVILDGGVPPGAPPLIVLDGLNTTGPNGWGISITGNFSTVRGLCLHHFFNHSAIVLRNGASQNKIEGNFIGTDAQGFMALGTRSGIDLVDADFNTIGGTTFGAGNVVAATLEGGIVLREGSDDNRVWGNFVGLGIFGFAPLPNVGHDLAIFDSMGNEIGSPAPSGRNVFAGNSNPGVASVALMSGVDGDLGTQTLANQIVGNYIGTNVTGNFALGGAGVAVYLKDVFTNHVGFAGPGGNVIGASDLDAVRIEGAGADTNDIVGNRIGLGADGTTALPIGGNGVQIAQSAHDNIVWGNVITNAAANGVLLLDDAGSSNRITQNQIFGNALLGIDLRTGALDPGGPTLNDALDSDTGPNGLQNYPVIEGISGTGQIVGTVSSTPSSFYAVELFQSPTCDPSGYGEAATFVGTANTTTDGAGDGSFAVTPLVPLSVGSFLTATATAANGSTSELSECFLVVEALFKDGFESGDTTEWSVTDSGNP